MTQNTETDIHIYNSTFSQLDRIGRNQQPPATAERQPEPENTLKITLESSPKLAQIEKQRKLALYIALYDPLQALHRRKTHEIGTKSAHDLSNKNVKKLYKVTFFEILAFFAEILTTSKYNHLNRLKPRRSSAGQQRPQTAPHHPQHPEA